MEIIFCFIYISRSNKQSMDDLWYCKLIQLLQQSNVMPLNFFKYPGQYSRVTWAPQSTTSSFFLWVKGKTYFFDTVEALISNHLGNSKKWSYTRAGGLQEYTLVSEQLVKQWRMVPYESFINSLIIHKDKTEEII